jgi:hypothetical protein
MNEKMKFGVNFRIGALKGFLMPQILFPLASDKICGPLLAIFLNA